MATVGEVCDGRWLACWRARVGQVSINGGTHLDFRVDDVAAAANAIVEIGGVLIKPPDTYVVDGEAVLEWAIMQDPFGNDFCIIKFPLDEPA